MKKYAFITIVIAGLLVSCGPDVQGLPQVKDDANVSFRRTNDLEKCTVSNLNYNENWFLENSYIYNEDLAKISLALSMAAIDLDEYDTTGKTGNENIKQAFQDLNFSSDNYYSIGYDEEDNNSVALSISTRDILFKEEETTLLSVCIRGKGYGSGGWLNNFTIGEGSQDIENVDNKQYHIGFYTSGIYTFKQINTYVKDHNIDLTKTKIWLSGYSRGGAVANIASILLGDVIDRDNIYTYADGTPGYKVNVTNDSTLKNIYNTLNTGDFVAMVPPNSWGFSIEGTTKNLSKINDNNRASFKANFSKFAGVEYTGLNNYDDIANSIVSFILKYIPTRQDYARIFEPTVKSLFVKDEEGNIDFSYLDNILTCEGSNSEALTCSDIVELAKNLDTGDLMKVFDLITKLDVTLEAGITYWADKDSYNDKLLTALKNILNDGVNLYMGSGSDEDKLAFSALKEILTLGISAPLLQQHWPETYLAKIYLSE